ncbi:MAG: hypothetical protein GW906_10540 [Epsilonproteobacteria bacterium]|nr:hypothetical protein [Campylobacterota bacterium]OIO15978.1 MAG: hypothetical protein AUJ81_05870 [Helicobacteraceae bacterium CG1_02_36_14]PIP10582.1 MAG: hypothetical protein COX50_05065 [Sulfurimonas sp. CG23_combo_of_CG06-09_8_20_14_all_36_33]PIS24314.1 MAG: hypothetical protein COT46_09805 [Sulfurimonas sp. CG08_land_8_20_14_0_20_36_33]PIU36246.1 MAG: hypothetical protein COT05_00095 [Sulfurimonas sp. CG07_land_8_20_14_0_80_36_56]PIV04265.1 MAG: hypothetical protein COS56_05565 [Sulfur
MKKTLLFYNLYPKVNWEEITASLLKNVPHDEIIVHVTLPIFPLFRKRKVINELKKYPNIKQVLFSKNVKKEGESIGFEKLKKEVVLNNYSILTYVHSKGSSKKRKYTKEVKDWTELMRYFVIERLDLTKKAFAEGYYLYGVNIREFGHKSIPTTPFHYSGNFVSINLTYLCEALHTVAYTKTYFGLEMFWGKLCSRDKAFSAHESNIVNHYEEEYPPEKYLNT